MLFLYIVDGATVLSRDNLSQKKDRPKRLSVEIARIEGTVLNGTRMSVSHLFDCGETTGQLQSRGALGVERFEYVGV